jgi:hypothetical protein
MKLAPPGKLGLNNELAEFDIWITPSLGEIRDTARFQSELDKVVEVFDALAASTHQFRALEDCSPEAISSALLSLISEKTVEDATEVLRGTASLLFLTTGKSDNNAECQLPLHLRDAAKRTSYPMIRGRAQSLTTVPIPRVLRSEDYMALVARLARYPGEQNRLLTDFVRFVLSDEKYVAQLWSIGHSYAQLKALRHERDLLTPLVIFQVRGSVSASGGHAPEKLLRERFDEWGLVRSVDYNTSDVVIDEGRGKGGRVKTRAYDFVLPFQTPDWSQHVYIQSQFYAGDSGSVSHKNVDQTSTSRRKVTRKNPGAMFVEYVDGAGYFSSLNGDLKTLLSMKDTHSFAQVRSAPIRLRRVLQEIGFCTPLEIEHAIARTDGSRKQVIEALVREEYNTGEIRRAIEVALARGALGWSDGKLMVVDQRRDIARRYLILDTVASNGRPISSTMAPAGGLLLVPGYGPFFGAKMKDVLTAAANAAPGFASDLKNSSVFIGDLQWLEENRFVVSA